MQGLKPTTGEKRLGFGSAGLPGRLGRAEAVALLEAAIDSGIGHFDTAPMYGNGAAEGLFSQLAAHHRHEMVIVTKAGIAPSNRFARAASKLTAGLVKLANANPRFGRFSAAQVETSIEHSLKAMGVDFVDALLLHEVTADDVTDDLRRALEDLQRDGKIGLVGIATSVEHTAEMIALHPAICQIVQAPLAWLDEDVATPKGATLAIHSVLGREFTALRERLAHDPNARALFQSATGVDAGNIDALAQFWLQAVRARNADGVTLFFSSRADRVRANAMLSAAEADAALRALREFEAAAKDCVAPV